MNNKLIVSQLPNELLSNIALYLIEPNINILSIGWKNNKYSIKYCQNSYNTQLNIYHNIINYYIFNNEYYNLFNLYKTIYNLNTSLRKYLPTYIFADSVFKSYPYLSYQSLIKLEYDTELNIKKKIKDIELCHINSIKNLKKYTIRELSYIIYYYNKTNYDIDFYSYYLNNYFLW